MEKLLARSEEDEGRGAYRRRIKTEEKAKVVASVLEGRIYSIPRHASCFAMDDLNYRKNCTRMI